MRHATIVIVLPALLALVLAGCTGSKKASSPAGGAATTSGSTAQGSTGGQTGGGSSLTVGWIFPGARDDAAIQALGQQFGDKVKVLVAENVADSDRTQAAQGLAGDGATLLVNAGAEVCSASPDLHCVEPAGTQPPAANVVAWRPAFWNQEYLAGRAAGLAPTKLVGFVGAAKTPQLVSAVNSLALGCQSTNPNCFVRAVWLDAKGAPKTAKKAAESLIDAGTQVVQAPSDDPALCKLAAKHKARLIGTGVDLASTCPDAVLTSVVVDPSKLVSEVIKSELDGSFEGGRTVVLGLDQGAALGEFGSGLLPKVEAGVTKAAGEVAGGQSPFVGPLYDNNGKERVPEGETLTEEFLASQWNWLLGGVVSST